MKEKIPIGELTAKVVRELERLNYAYNTVCGFRAFYRRFIEFATEKNEPYYSESLGFEFLKEKYNFSLDLHKGALPRRLLEPVRRIRTLGDYQLHGVIVRRVVKKPAYEKPPQFERVLSQYEVEFEKNNYSKRGLRTRIQRLYFFIDYIALKKLQNFNEITPGIISDYVKTIYRYHEKSISAILSALRTFLRFLYLNTYTEKDLSLDVPKAKKVYHQAIPSVWKTEDVTKLIGSVDRGNPCGKRDYAILLMIAKLGMRVGDLKALRLHDLKWDRNTIEINQTKTGRQLVLPILNDIGWALIDYLKNGRPETDSPYVFVRMHAPFDSFGENANLHNVITKHIRLAGINIPKGKKHGMHSLRHTLASSLLEQGTPLSVISEILGHLNSKTINVYLETGIEKLKQCALNPEGVFNYDE